MPRRYELALANRSLLNDKPFSLSGRRSSFTRRLIILAQKICVFDAYGTLFDVAAAARRAAQEDSSDKLANAWESIARDWRLKQLQYTWIRAATGSHTDFWTVTCESLDWALEAAGLSADQGLRSRLLALYEELDAYSEVSTVLSKLKSQGNRTAILSNGNPKMLSSAIAAAGISGTLDAVLSAESAGIFKPHRQVYDLVVDRFSCSPGEVVFVSSNGWDAAAATGYGFTTAWVNRVGEPVDQLPWKPDRVLSDLHGVVEMAKQ